MSTALSSGSLAVGTTTVVGFGTYLNSVQVNTDGTNAATVTVYNNTAASGTIIALVQVAGAGLHTFASFNHPVRADIGLTVVVAGTGATAIVTHSAGA